MELTCMYRISLFDFPEEAGITKNYILFGVYVFPLNSHLELFQIIV